MMKKNIFLTAIIFAAVLLNGCNVPQEPYKKTFFAMDTYMTVTAYGENAETAAEKVSRKIAELDSLWSATNESSEIFRIDHGSGDALEISAETADILQKALEISEFTGGALDCTIYPVLTEWGFTTGEYHIPDDEKIAELLLRTGYEKISLSGNILTVPEGMQIDLGAMGKGQASEIAAKILRENGVEHALIDLGGNIRTVGTKPDGSNWRLGLRDPFGDGNIGIIEISEGAVVTSGGYERYFVGDDGKKYSHIIDPDSGRPAESGLASVTIVGNDAALCDGLSTAMFVLGAEKAEDLWRQRNDIEMILITDDKDILITEQVICMKEKSLSGERFNCSIDISERDDREYKLDINEVGSYVTVRQPEGGCEYALMLSADGDGKPEDFVRLFKELPWVDAGLAASVFHYKEIEISSLKEMLNKNDIAVRL